MLGTIWLRASRRFAHPPQLDRLVPNILSLAAAMGLARAATASPRPNIHFP